MQTWQVLADAFERVRESVRDVVDGLDSEALAFRPDSQANSIAWLLWHAARVQDDHVSEIAGLPQAWVDEGWAEHFRLPADPSDTGYGHTSDQVARVRPEDARLLVDYHDAVLRRTLSYLQTVDHQELERIIDERWDPPVTVGVRLVSVIEDSLQHVGQAAYVRGLLQRSGRGTPSTT